MSARERARASRNAIDALRASGLLRRVTRIGLYWPADGELDPRPVMLLPEMRRTDFFLPVLAPVGPAQLWFAPYRSGSTRLVRNRFGIPEPVATNAAAGRCNKALGLVLTPLVGFGAAGARLGMGAGYYDRTFAFLRHRRVWARPWLVGLAHSSQFSHAVKPAPWDVPLAAVATERGVIWFASGQT